MRIRDGSPADILPLCHLLYGMQVNGHFMSKLDPLKLDQRPTPIELDPNLYGFTDKDLDREFFLGTWNMKGFLSEDRPIRTLREVLQRLRESYCGSIGYEVHPEPNGQKSLTTPACCRCHASLNHCPGPAPSLFTKDPVLALTACACSFMRVTPAVHAHPGPGQVQLATGAD